MTHEPNFGVANVPLTDIYFADGLCAVDGPSREALAPLISNIFTVADSSFPLVGVYITGCIYQDHGDYLERNEVMAPVIASWKQLAELAAGIDEIVKGWGVEERARFLAVKDQASVAYRIGRRKAQQRGDLPS